MIACNAASNKATKRKPRCLIKAVILPCLERHSFRGNLIRILGPYFEGGSCQTPWGIIPRNLTLPLSEHPLSNILVLDLNLSGVCHAFSFSARHVVALRILWAEKPMVKR